MSQIRAPEEDARSSDFQYCGVLGEQYRINNQATLRQKEDILSRHEDDKLFNLAIQHLATGQHKLQPEGLVLTKRPLATLKFFLMAALQYLWQLVIYLATHKVVLLIALPIVLTWGMLRTIKGPHEQIMKEMSAYLRYAFWWVGLGVASSIGLGSGLHTFLLYLGPHIAMFTIKATHCGRVDLKSAPYDTAVFGKMSTWELKDCLEFGQALYLKASKSERYQVPLLPILHEVHWEAVLWGIGTALGELPPYFVSRAARLSGDRLKEYEYLKLKTSTTTQSSSIITNFLNRVKSWVIDRFQRSNFARQYQFWTILVFASIPNPLFDLAGITCGQLLVPFWSFFIPTLIGKAVVKTHIQTVFVILLCNNQLMEHLESSVIHMFEHMPTVSRAFSHILTQLESIKHNYHMGPTVNEEMAWKFSIPLLWNTFVWIMLLGFFSSIINSTAQSYVMEKQKIECQSLNGMRSKDE